MIDTKLKTSDFYYDLPEELIAQAPLEDRTNSRLMVLDKLDGSITHKHFYDIVDYLNSGDCIVINDTKVLPARLYGTKKDSNALIELLLLKRIDDKKWETLVKPGKKAKENTEIIFNDKVIAYRIPFKQATIIKSIFTPTA